MTDRKRYETITTNFCGQEFVSIRVDGQDLYPLSSLAKTDISISPNIGSDSLKAIFGEGFNFAKHLTNLSRRAVNCLSHDQLDTLIDHLAFNKGCIFSRDLLRASFNVELKRSNDYTRGESLKEECYQQWRDERAAGIKRRRLFTDAIKMWIELGNDYNYGFGTLECYRHTGLIEKYNAWKLLYETRADRAKNPFRCTLNTLELMEIGSWEECVARRMNKVACSPEVAMLWVRENL